jgi:RNA polymerase sigma factor (sigma-70 family)
MTIVAASDDAEARAPDTKAAFGAWVSPHLLLIAHLAGRLAPADERDDVVQNALTRAWLMRARFDPGRGTPAAWLLAITADQARQANRRRRPAALFGDVPTNVMPVDERIDIERAVASLPARQRLAVDCFYFAGLSVADTSAVMGCSEGTVKSTLFDARERLRPLLEGTDD